MALWAQTNYTHCGPTLTLQAVCVAIWKSFLTPVAPYSPVCRHGVLQVGATGPVRRMSYLASEDDTRLSVIESQVQAKLLAVVQQHEASKAAEEAKRCRAEYWAAKREMKNTMTTAERAQRERELAERDMQWRLAKELEKEQQMKAKLSKQARQWARAHTRTPTPCHSPRNTTSRTQSSTRTHTHEPLHTTILGIATQHATHYTTLSHIRSYTHVPCLQLAQSLPTIRVLM